MSISFIWFDAQENEFRPLRQASEGSCASAVERAGMRGLNEGQKISFDVVTERGKSAAANLRTV